MPRVFRTLLAALSIIAALGTIVTAASVLGGTIPGPLPIFPRDNWWNLDISTAPLDPSSASYISFIGPTKTMHPDFGGDESPGSVQIYGFPYAVVDGTTPLRTVQFYYSARERRGESRDESEFPLLPDSG